MTPEEVARAILAVPVRLRGDFLAQVGASLKAHGQGYTGSLFEFMAKIYNGESV